MGKGISIGVGADTRQFSQAVSRGIVEPLEGVEKALEGVTRDGDRAGDKLVDAMQDAQKQTQRLERDQKSLSDVVARESARGSRAMKTEFNQGTSAAKRDLAELGNEARQNASETFSSFDGSAESFADGIQGTLGGIVSSLGPIGAAAGAAGALGIGLIIGAITNADEQTAVYKERVAELGQQFIEAGQNGEAGLEFLVDKLQELATETDSTNLKQLAAAAKDSGSDFRELALAYAGNTKGLKELWRTADTRLDQMREEADLIDTTTSAGTKNYSQMMKRIDAQQKYMDYLGQSLGVARDAAEQERLYAEAGGPELAAKAESLDAYAGAVQDALTESGAAWEDYTHDGIVNLDEYNAAIEAQAEAVRKYQDNMVTASATLSEEALNYIRSLGPAAAPLLQAYVDAPLDQKARTEQNWSVLGSAAASSYTNDLKAGIPDQIDGPTITARPDFSAWESAIREFQQRDYSVGVGVRLRPGQETP